MIVVSSFVDFNSNLAALHGILRRVWFQWMTFSVPYCGWLRAEIAASVSLECYSSAYTVELQKPAKQLSKICVPKFIYCLPNNRERMERSSAWGWISSKCEPRSTDKTFSGAVDGGRLVIKTTKIFRTIWGLRMPWWLRPVFRKSE